MARFRSKPKEIEAEQWLPGKTVSGVRSEVINGNLHHLCRTVNGAFVHVSSGDWIIIEKIQNVPGETLAYPCVDEIFRQTYDPID